MKKVALMAGAVGLCTGVARAQTCMWTESPTVLPRPQKRVGAAIAYDSVRGRVVLFGGYGLAAALGDTYEWTGTLWVLRATTGPSPREGAAMAFHPGINKTVLVGGDDGGSTSFGDTWTWDGGSWVQVQATGMAAGPMAYDDARSRMLRMTYSETQFWMYSLNAATWTWELASGPIARPFEYSPRYMMAYDSARARMVIYGGATVFELGNAWWEFSGAGTGNWIRRGNGPPARTGSRIAFDPHRGRTVIFGGQGASAFPLPGEIFGDLWECDGTTWVERTEDGPGPRTGHSMVFDGTGIFCFGGAGTDGAPVSQASYHQDVWKFDGGQSLGVVITQRPVAQSAFLGQTVTFTVAATGAATFQWYRDATPLTNGGEYSGVTTDTLTITGVSVVDRATFSVQASAGCGAATAGAALRVFDQFCYANCDGSTVQPFLNSMTSCVF